VTRIIREGKKRRTPLLGTALLCLAVGMMIGGGGFASAASTSSSISDYSQCPNGTSHGLVCLSTGWINGILNANNSSYREDEVTPQRMLLLIPKGGAVTNHRIDVTYLARKGGTTGGNHAYDSLANWNYTETGADRCQGASASTPLAHCPAASPSDTFDIPTDPQVVQPFTSPSGVTSDHALSGQSFILYGPAVNAVAATPVHTCPITDATHNCASSDDYATIQITFDLDGTVVDTAAPAGKVDADTYVQLVFGGHLASSLTPSTGSQRGWGGSLSNNVCTGCIGASSINGGPYHIRITNIDGSSIGNRDNQISAGAVQPLFTPTLTTQPGNDETFSELLKDSLNVGNSSAGGTATFTLYGPFAPTDTITSTSCVASGQIGANQLWTSGSVTVSGGKASTVGVTGSPSATPKTVSPTTESIYEWVVTYSGDPANNLGSANTICGDESVDVKPPSVTLSPNLTFPA
jgi:hypothetical protein